MGKKRVLILCTGNSTRSQMAEGLLRHEAGDVFEIWSAGTNPTHIRPEAVAVMREVGIDISHQWSKSLQEFLGLEFDYVITVCDHARELCPVFPGNTRHLHWSVQDPALEAGDDGERETAFRKMRDQIKVHLKGFIADHDGRGYAAAGR